MSTSYGSFGTGTVSDFGGGKTYEFAKKKYGNIGKKISVYSNYFSIDVNCRIVYHYNIDIQVHDYVKDSGDSNVPQRSKLSQQKKMFKNVNFLVFDTLCKEHNTIFSSEPVFDGAKNIYSKTKLRLDNDKTTKLTIEQRVQERKFKVKFDVIITTPKDSHELDLSILNEPNVRNAEKEIQALDIIMQYGPKRHKISVGSNFFLTKADLQELPLGVRKSIRFDLGEMKEVSYGHYQSAKLTEKGIQLNVDRVAIVFNKGGKLINLIEQLCTELRSGPQRRDSAPPRQIEINQSFKFNQNELKLLNEELKGLDFEVDHISYKPKNKIFAITEKSVCEIKFTEKLKDGTTRETSVKEYFEKIYVDYLDRLGRDLYPNLPCVQVGKINPKFFPLEVVSIIEDQYSTRKLKPKHQATMTRTCGQQQPTQRFEESKIQAEKLIGTPRAGQTDYLKNFDIKVRTNYAECNGRVLDPASILYKDNRNVRPRDGQWRADGKFVIPSENVGSNWMVINFTRDYNNQIRFAPQRNQIDDFIRTVIQCSRDSGLNLQNPCNVVYNEAYRGRQDLEDAMADYLQDHKDCRLIIYVVPKLDELYSNIKYLSEIVFGVVTQCVSQDKSKQFVQMQYVSNLMLKINSKLGGSNVHLAPESKVAYLKKKTMIMGLDTTHPSERDRLANSVSSVVATYDKYMVNYFSRCVVQPKPRSEIIQLDEITKEMLDNFKKVNGFHPDFLLIYRDGISEGQFKEVVDKEINLIKKAFSQISPSYNPKITFIVVQKRHHTRFLAANPRDRIPKSQNVLPGTCIDNTITSNYYFDFFLCAHFGALGTSRPTRYFVLHDDTDFSGDEIQQTTNVLSYLFPRCLKAVSIPPAVLYAHLACKRARSYLFTLDNNRGIVFGEKELTATEIKELNQKIEVKSNLRNILYYV